MNKQTETALKMAIEALEKYVGVVQHKLNAETWGDIEDGGKPARNAIQACKEALSDVRSLTADLEQPTQKNIRQSFNEMLEDKVAHYKGEQPTQRETYD